MKALFKYVVIMLFGIIGFLYLFDFIYTQAYYSTVIRNKNSWTKSDKFPDSLDYVLLGSSRCIHHIQPELIAKKTSKQGLNLGYPACGPVEIKLMLHQVIKECSVKKIYIQVDEKYNETKPNTLAIVSWLPFIHEDYIYQEIKKYDSRAFFHKYIPFYRYQINDPKIGFRNVALTYFGKESQFLKQQGYMPLTGRKSANSQKGFTFDFVKERNPIFDEILKTARKHEIEVFFFTAPYFRNRVDFSYLGTVLDNYYDFSNLTNDPNHFKNISHLNHDGATLFTNQFIKHYFKNVNDSTTSYKSH